MNTGGPEARLIDGRFELVERLGGGGMGLVWRARDTALEREVALKEVRPPDPAMLAADPAAAHELRERVLREARALARLQHPNVAVIHHIVDGAEHQHPWLVMELISGGSLADRLSRGPLDVPEAARIGRGVLSALRAAHAAGIQHRDVKPGNVLLRPDGTPVLTDFGIAAMQEATALTATGSLIGSPEYIAPERIRGQEGNPSSDLWSLGMMLYVAVEGHHPLRRATTLATLAAVMDEPLPPPTRCGPLGPVLSAVLARDPAVRPDAAQLDRLLAAAEQAPAGGPAGGYVQTSLDTPYPQGGPGPSSAWAPGGFGGGSSGGTPNPYTAGQGSGQTPNPYATGPGSGPTANPYGAPAQPGAVTAGSFGQVGPYGGSGQVTNPWTPGGSGAERPKRGARTGVIAASVAVAVVVAGGVAWKFAPGTAKKNTAGHSSTAGTTAGTTAGATGGTGTSARPTTAATATGSTGAPKAAPKDLITPDGVRTAIAALTPVMGTGKVYKLVVYPQYAIADAPTAANPKEYDSFQYRNGRASKDDMGGTEIGDDQPVDLSVYDWSIIPSLLQKAQATLNVTNPTSRYLIIGPDLFDNKPVISVYLSNDHSNSGYLETDPHGNVVRTVPAE
ncbi:protein kinase [Kitasatospora sp. NPDC059571]|uniref:serine/threonine-protein kinase n=1 Tax=Kitasatospora sp. NPDC059571 TaxID=3346871 RepID=UPI003688199E